MEEVHFDKVNNWRLLGTSGDLQMGQVGIEVIGSYSYSYGSSHRRPKDKGHR